MSPASRHPRPPAERPFYRREPAASRLAGPRARVRLPGRLLMTSEERSELSLSFAKVLYVNGQATDQIVAAIRRLGNKLGIKAEVLPRWGELQLRTESGGVTPISYVAADPVGVDMDRVVSTMQAVADIETGRLSPEDACKRIDVIAKAPPAPTWLFAL